MVTLPDSVFSANSTHERIFRAGNRLIATSEELGWRPLHAAIFEEGPFVAKETPVGHSHLIYVLNRPTEMTRRIEDGPSHKQVVPIRSLSLTPGQATTHWQHDGNPEILQVYIHNSLYESAVGELFGCDPSKEAIIPRFAKMDPLLEQLTLALSNALR